MVAVETSNPTLEEKVDEEGDVKVDDDFDSDEEIPFEYSITSYGADYTVDSLVKRVEQDSIFVPPVNPRNRKRIRRRIRRIRRVFALGERGIHQTQN